MSDFAAHPDFERLRQGEKTTLAFDREDYEDRLDELRERMDSAGVATSVLTAPSSIAYYCGFSGAIGGRFALIVREDDDVILSPGEDGARVWQQCLGDNVTYRDGAFWQAVKAVAGAGGVIGYEGDHLTLHGRDALEDHVAPVVMVDMALGVMHQQMYKSPAELDLMRQCAALVDDGAKAVRDGIRAGVPADAVAQAGRTAMGLGSQVRIRSGGVLQSGDMVSFELSAQMNGYGAPLGRMAFVGSIDDQSRKDWEASVAVQDYAISLLKPGVSCGQIAGQISAYLAEAGLMSMSDYGCSVGVSGSSGALALRGDNDMVLEPDMVLSVAPVVFGPTGSQPFREEDVVLITDDAAEVLTMCPKGPQFNVLG